MQFIFVHVFARTLTPERDFVWGSDDEEEVKETEEKPKVKNVAVNTGNKGKTKPRVEAKGAVKAQDEAVTATQRFVASRKVAPRIVSGHHLVRTTPSQGQNLALVQ